MENVNLSDIRANMIGCQHSIIHCARSVLFKRKGILYLSLNNFLAKDFHSKKYVCSTIHCVKILSF